MKTLSTLFLATALLVGSGVADVNAQGGVRWRGEGGWGPAAPYARRYNPQTVETVSGEVTAVERVTPMKGMSHGVHLRLRAGEDTVSVHLGPDWYIENQDVKLEVGDRIDVKGSRITLDGTAVLIAAEVKKGDRILTLRDGNGVPAWSGWRRR